MNVKTQITWNNPSTRNSFTMETSRFSSRTFQIIMSEVQEQIDELRFFYESVSLSLYVVDGILYGPGAGRPFADWFQAPEIKE